MLAQTTDKPPHQRLLQGEDAKLAVVWQLQVNATEAKGQYVEAPRFWEQLLALRQRTQGPD